MIKKCGKFYRLDIWCGKHRVRRSLRTDERALALDRAREIERELRAPRPKGLLLAEFSEKYLEWAKQTKPASVRGEEYRVAIIRDYMKSAGITTLEGITTYAVEQFRASVRARDRRVKVKEKEHEAAKSTVNRYCALLRTMINRARDWGMFEGSNPVSKIKFYREPGKVRPLSPAEVGKVIGAARRISADPQSPAQALVADLIILMLNTGLRRSEALGVRWRDWRGANIEVVGKGERRRVVPLNAQARAVIERQPRVSPFIFDMPNRHQPDNLRRTVKRIRKLSGVEHFHLHLCRHYAMTAMLAAGVDIQTAAEVLGHSRLSTSLLYAHTSPERKMRAVETIEIGIDDRQRTVDVSAQVADK